MTAFLPQEVIRAKRDGRVLAEDEIAAFVAGITDRTVSDGQVAAFAMAVFLRGLESVENVALTRAMTRSGRVISWPDLGRPILDKHSTGGVGDKVSLILAPILAACGAAVPMISGRGLGHTGGTLDKLESIPGYCTTPDINTFQRVVAEVGCAIIGQTDDLAPADRRLYAIRDVTATVESIPLITASILSKKLAAGLDGLVMDVKVGSGAFMTAQADAETLANSIVTVANDAGLPTRALITNMDQVLGRTVGNALEVHEAINFLTNARRDPRLEEVTIALCCEILTLGRLAPTVDAARTRVAEALSSGAAAETFQRMVAALGGAGDVVDALDTRLPRAEITLPVLPDRSGILVAVDTRAVGLVVLALGGGRMRADQEIDHAVGLTAVAAVGEAVGPERPIAVVHARSREDAERAVRGLGSACYIGDAPPPTSPVVKGLIVG